MTLSSSEKATSPMDTTASRRSNLKAPAPRTPAPDTARLEGDVHRRMVVRHVLPLYSDVLSDNFVLDISSAHRIGYGWAESGRSLEWLLEAVRSLTSDLVDRALHRREPGSPDNYGLAVEKISDVGTRILVELAHGFRRACAEPQAHEELTQHRLAQLMLTGAATPPDGLLYAVIAVATSRCDPAATDEEFRANGGEHTLTLLGETGGHVLLPAATEADAAERCTRALALLGKGARAALVWPDHRSFPACRSVADDILTEAVALEVRPGLHLLEDVLLEFAAAREPVVSNALLKVIQPLLSQPVLWETLQVLLSEDGHRGKVAERLILHRSTVDYRLQRIDQLTGHSPCTIRGLRVLATASAMHRLAEVRRTATAA